MLKFFFIIAIIFFVLTFVLRLIGGVFKIFGVKRGGGAYDPRNPYQKDNNQYQNSTSQPAQKKFSKNEGEYVEYEEVKEDKEE